MENSLSAASQRITNTHKGELWIAYESKALRMYFGL